MQPGLKKQVLEPRECERSSYQHTCGEIVSENSNALPVDDTHGTSTEQAEHSTDHEGDRDQDTLKRKGEAL